MIELGEDTVRALVEALQAMPQDAKVRVWPQYLTGPGQPNRDTITEVGYTPSGVVELWV